MPSGTYKKSRKELVLPHNGSSKPGGSVCSPKLFLLVLTLARTFCIFAVFLFGFSFPYSCVSPAKPLGNWTWLHIPFILFKKCLKIACLFFQWSLQQASSNSSQPGAVPHLSALYYVAFGKCLEAFFVWERGCHHALMAGWVPPLPCSEQGLGISGISIVEANSPNVSYVPCESHCMLPRRQPFKYPFDNFQYLCHYLIFLIFFFEFTHFLKKLTKSNSMFEIMGHCYFYILWYT